MNIFLKTLHIFKKKDTKIGSQNFGNQILFCTRLLMLATIRDDTWNVLNMQHITPNSKKNGVIQTSMVVALQNIKGPTQMVEIGHHLWKKSQTPPTKLVSFNTRSLIYCFIWYQMCIPS